MSAEAKHPTQPAVQQKQPRRLGSKTTTTTTTSNVSVYFLTVVVIFSIFGLYYLIRIRPGLMAKRKPSVRPPPSAGVPDTAHREPKKVQAPEKALSTMYVPTEVGHPVGRERVFLTNKGLRTYPVNEYGFPLPPTKA